MAGGRCIALAAVPVAQASDGTPVVSAGYGNNWTKLHGTKPTGGLGPQTDLGGGNEVKRIARLGPIKNLFVNSLVRQAATSVA